MEETVSVNQIRIDFRPQPGPQEMFLATPADIAIYGGSAGGGKTWGLLIEAARHHRRQGYGAVIFRRTYPEITNEGGLWDESEKIYPLLGARPVKGDLYWKFPNGSKISFGHLQFEKDLMNYQGAQIALIGYDQLEHFTQKMFFYMLSRNRSVCGVRPYIRATCNPDPDSFLANFLSWWIAEDGYADLSKAGKIRWFIQPDGQMVVWGDSREELIEKYGDGVDPLSVTFIPASVFNNKILLAKDPGYLAKLKALSYVDRERLLGDPMRGGNWKVKPTAGKFFNRTWFKLVKEVPASGIVVRRWDFAATAKELVNDDPDYTASCLMLRSQDGSFYILDVTAAQMGPAEVDKYFMNLTHQDAVRFREEKRQYLCRWEQEPGSAGKRESFRLTKLLAGIDAHGISSTGDKLVRAKPLAAQAEAGNVYLLEGPWNEMFLSHMHGQPDLPHDDIMDSASGAFDDLSRPILRIARSYQG